MCLETLTSIIRTGLPILVEWIDLVNSYNFSISNGLTQIVNFPPGISDFDFHSPACFDLFLSSDASIYSAMAFTSLEIMIMLLSEFPLTFHRSHNCMSHFSA